MALERNISLSYKYSTEPKTGIWWKISVPLPDKKFYGNLFNSTRVVAWQRTDCHGETYRKKGWTACTHERAKIDTQIRRKQELLLHKSVYFCTWHRSNRLTTATWPVCCSFHPSAVFMFLTSWHRHRGSNTLTTPIVDSHPLLLRRYYVRYTVSALWRTVH